MAGRPRALRITTSFLNGNIISQFDIDLRNFNNVNVGEHLVNRSTDVTIDPTNALEVTFDPLTDAVTLAYMNMLVLRLNRIDRITPPLVEQMGPYSEDDFNMVVYTVYVCRSFVYWYHEVFIVLLAQETTH